MCGVAAGLSRLSKYLISTRNYDAIIRAQRGWHKSRFPSLGINCDLCEPGANLRAPALDLVTAFKCLALKDRAAQAFHGGAGCCDHLRNQHALNLVGARYALQ